jgi:hypothetical protein
MTNRRQFLAGICAGVGVAALPQLARASGPCQYKILEIFPYGACSHRDTFWVDQGGSAPWREEPDMASVDPAAAGETSIPFLAQGQQGLPYDLSVGACFAPFVGTQLLDRMRLVTLYNELGVHPVAAAIKLTGAGLGRPGSASIGAHIDSQFSGAMPSSYVIDANLNPQITRYCTIGSQVATGKPLIVPLGSDAFIDKLNRTGVVTDPLVDMYRDRYAQLLQSGSSRVRSPAFDTYSDSLDRSIGWESIYDLLSGFPTFEAPDPFTGDQPNFLSNRMTRGIELACYLLDHGARHVIVLGGGSNAHPTVDTHDIYPGPDYVAHATRQNAVMYGIAKALRAQFDQGKLPLDQTLISWGSEFGRRADELDGSEHWVDGYAHVLIGACIGARGVAGYLDFAADTRGKAQDGFHPSELNAALCIAAGVDPARFGTPATTSALTTSLLGVDPTTQTCEIGIGGIQNP